MGSGLKSGALLAAIGAIAVSACGTRPTPEPRPRPQVQRPTGRPAVRPPSAAEFLRAAASLDLFEIRSSELALTRARNPRIREFARMMIAGHRGTAAQLSLAGRRLGLLPTPSLLPREQAMLEELARSADFDSAYRGQQIRAHTAAITLHGSYAARGASPTLRPVAANALPIVRRHLEILRRL